MNKLRNLAVAFATLSSAVLAADFLPLEMGNFWVYQETRTGQSFTIRVGTPVWLQSGRQYSSLQGYAGKNVLARINEEGNLVTLDEDNQTEQLLTAFAAPESESWPAPGRECKLEGQTQSKRTQYSGPAGRWNQALAVTYRSVQCADAGPTSETFAENIGMLRREVSTIAGPRAFDLVYARIGNSIIDNRDRGRFTVTVDQPEDKDVWRVTLRLDIGYMPSLRMRFPSAQEYDVALRDAEGNVIWTWSDGRFFEQSAHETNLGNLWNVTVDVPRPAADPIGYTIEGWLTTAPGTAKLAATAPAPPPRP